MHFEMDMPVREDYVLHKPEQPLGFQPSRVMVENAQHEVDIAWADTPWADPLTGEPLVVSSEKAVNFPTESSAGEDFTDVTELVKQFFVKTLFPNYDDSENRPTLLEKSRAGLFARLPNEQIPFNARVVEIGCGTGQLINFLSECLSHSNGIDVYLPSLRLAQAFKTGHALERATFAQMNLFRPGLRDGVFDHVISNGVLHDSGETHLAFRRISRLVKRGDTLQSGFITRIAVNFITLDARSFVGPD